jgi:hypothetical protein
MAHEQIRVDVTNNPDMRRLAEAVKHSRTPHVPADGGEELAVVLPLTRKSLTPNRNRSTRQAKGAFTREDPLFGLIGIGEGKTPGGVSGRKHEALARAYRPK